MRHLIVSLCVFVLSALAGFSAQAVTPQEKDFLDAYRKALESNDIKTLEGFLYAKNADPDALAYFRESLPLEEGFKLAQLDIVGVTPEEAQKALQPKHGPDGRLSALPVTPTGKLIIKVESQGADNSSLTTQRAVASVEGGLKILVPAIVDK